MLQEFELLIVSLRTFFASVDTCSILPTGITAASLNVSFRQLNLRTRVIENQHA